MHRPSSLVSRSISAPAARSSRGDLQVHQGDAERRGHVRIGGARSGGAGAKMVSLRSNTDIFQQIFSITQEYIQAHTKSTLFSRRSIQAKLLTMLCHTTMLVFLYPPNQPDSVVSSLPVYSLSGARGAVAANRARSHRRRRRERARSGRYFVDAEHASSVRSPVAVSATPRARATGRRDWLW